MTRSTLFGIPIEVSDSLGKDEMWLANERCASAIRNYDQGTIFKDERDVILGEELFEGRAALTKIT